MWKKTNNNNPGLKCLVFCDHFTILLKIISITVCTAEYAVHRLSLCDTWKVI